MRRGTEGNFKIKKTENNCNFCGFCGFVDNALFSISRININEEHHKERGVLGHIYNL